MSTSPPNGTSDNLPADENVNQAEAQWRRPTPELSSGSVSGLAPTSEEELLNWEEAAALLKVRVSWLKYKVKHKQIPCTRPGAGRQVRFSRFDVLEIARMGQTAGADDRGKAGGPAAQTYTQAIKAPEAAPDVMPASPSETEGRCRLRLHGQSDSAGRSTIL